MGRWHARTLQRAGGADVLFVIALLALACGTLLAGRAASFTLSPDGTAEIASALDDLELPERLPDVVLLDEQGNRAGLLARITKPRAVVAFYAPWCGPCQEELPELDRGIDEDKADLLIVIGKNEDRADARRKFDNLGLQARGFLVDEHGQLARSARVTSLPTTFVITRHGRVLARAKGYSHMGLWRLKNRAHLGASGGQ